MQVRFHAIATLGLTTLIAAGCAAMPFGRDEPRATPRPAPVAAAPAGSITATPLPPPAGAASTQPSGLAALDPSLQGGAPATPPSGGASVEVTRPDLLGSWTIASAGDSCQLSMALTTWTGGYRASTRGCSNEALKGISAWTLEGGQVQLFNDSGATVARLFPASKTQFNGQTQGGGPVSVSR